LGARLPLAVQRLFMESLLYLSRGSQRDSAFPTPGYPLLREHPTVSSDLLNLIGQGRITSCAGVLGFEGDQVVLQDGSRVTADNVIFATGYRVSFPFFDTGLISTAQNRVDLYRYVASPDVPNLYFIGLVQPLGAIMPLAELQAEWVADLVQGEAVLPPEAAMRSSIVKVREHMKKRYVDSPRHTMQVDFYPYAELLKKERKRGQKRVKRS
jgi:hypothetical protein